MLEVAGPLIARYYSLWDLLLLRLLARDEPPNKSQTVEKEAQSSESVSIHSDGSFSLQDLSPIDETATDFTASGTAAKSQSLRSASNRVQWLLMELRSLAETLHSLAGDLFHPALMHSSKEAQIEVVYLKIYIYLAVL